MMGWGNMMNGYGWGYNGAGSYWWMGLIGMALHFVFWIAIIAIVWSLVKRYGFNGSGSYSNSNKALEILSERFAKGEIDLEEYTHQKENLLH